MAASNISFLTTIFPMDEKFLIDLNKLGEDN